MTVLSWVGNVSAGLLAAIAWDASPWGLLLVAVPIALLYLAYRAWLAQTVENELMEDIAHAADEITRDGDLAVRLPTGAAAPAPGRADGHPEPDARAHRGLVPAPAALHARRRRRSSAIPSRCCGRASRELPDGGRAATTCATRSRGSRASSTT